jgi:diguanylate cyclase
MAMLLVDIHVGEAFEIVEIIRQRYASSSLKKKGSEESIGQVTVSIGLSQVRDYDTPQTLIERTDQALYQSKAEGRNRTTLL